MVDAASQDWLAESLRLFGIGALQSQGSSITGVSLQQQLKQLSQAGAPGFSKLTRVRGSCGTHHVPTQLCELGKARLMSSLATFAKTTSFSALQSPETECTTLRLLHNHARCKQLL